MKKTKDFNKKKFVKELKKIYKNKGIDDAVVYCKNLLNEYPTNGDLHVRLGDLYLEWHLDIYQAKQYLDEAITEYQIALETNINSALIYYKLGVAFFHKAELDKAINYFNLVIENNYEIGNANYMLALCFMKKDRFVNALEYVEKAIKYQKLKSSRAHYLAFSLLKLISFRNFKTSLRSKWELFLAFLTLPFDKDALKDFKKTLLGLKLLPKLAKGFIIAQTQGLNYAIDFYIELIEKAPNFVPLYCLLGDMYANTGRFEEAICEYKMAIWLDPLNIHGYKALCQTYKNIGDYDNAIISYYKLIDIHPQNPVSHAELAELLFSKGDIKRAIVHYQNAMTLNPDRKWTSVIAQTLGYIFQENKNDIDAAISAYQSAYLLTPEDIDIYINLGAAFYDKGENDNALTVYRTALEIDPSNARIYCNLGYLYWNKGEIQEAIKEYELAIKYNKYYDIAYNNLGVIYLDDLGMVQKSIELFETAIEVNPNYALAHYNLARAIAIIGDKIEAAKLYQAAKDLNSFTHEMNEAEIVEKINTLFD